jgi:hypothetical protein|tara:strand:+ start:101 stop:535 length:435 start_codon:yes stop_codon:yes gene_type:complete
VSKSKQLGDKTKLLIKNFEDLEKGFNDLIRNPENTTPEFFAEAGVKALSMIPLTQACLLLLPTVTPPTANVQRIQYQDVLVTLQQLTTVTIPQLQTLAATFLTSPEPATKAAALTNIVALLPGIVLNYGRLKVILNLIKVKMRI